MTKMKSSSAAKKRFKLVGKKKVKRAQAFRRHILTKKGPKKRRQLRSGAYISDVDLPRVLVLLSR